MVFGGTVELYALVFPGKQGTFMLVFLKLSFDL